MDKSAVHVLSHKQVDSWSELHWILRRCTCNAKGKLLLFSMKLYPFLKTEKTDIKHCTLYGAFTVNTKETSYLSCCSLLMSQNNDAKIILTFISVWSVIHIFLSSSNWWFFIHFSIPHLNVVTQSWRKAMSIPQTYCIRFQITTINRKITENSLLPCIL